MELDPEVLEATYQNQQHLSVEPMYPDCSNAFFFPNMCHVCRSFGEAIHLKRCGACNMISYCSEDHQKQDWPTHKEFCKAVGFLKKKHKVDNLFQSLKHFSRLVNIQRETNFLCDESLEDFAKELVVILRRKLKHHEVQMIYYPRICAVCFESNTQLLFNCRKCPQCSFCKKHLNDSNHEKDCHKFIIIFHCHNKMNVLFSLHSMIHGIKATYKDKAVKLPASMTDFFETRLSKISTIRDTLDEEGKIIFNYVLSQKYSNPLTLLFALKNLNFTSSSILVHVIGPSMDEPFFNDWETIFHYLPQLHKLELFFIGPDLRQDSILEPIVCDECKKNEKRLIINAKRTLYEKYFTSKNIFKNPDITVIFNPNLHTSPSWNKCVEVFGKTNCPLLITAVQQNEGLLDHAIINGKFPSANCVLSDHNPFQTFLYERVIRNVIYTQNKFILLYKNLGVMKKPSF